MAGCITEDYKNIILGMLEQEMEKSVITGLVKAIPICPTVGAAPSKPAEKKRSVPEPWGLSIYSPVHGAAPPRLSPAAAAALRTSRTTPAISPAAPDLSASTAAAIVCA